MSNYLNLSSRKKIRIGLIGLGQRGLATLQRYLLIPEAEIVAVCDINNQALVQAQSLINSKVALDSDWKKTCQRDDIDLIYVCTDWNSHAKISIFALNCGKNVACEIPAIISIEEGQMLIEAVETSGRFFTMMENCCYDPFALSTLKIAKEGLLGEITHCEGAYIHDLRDLYAGKWYGTESARCAGNPYPTHGIGPICQLLDIGQSDSLAELVSVSPSTPGMNSTIIRTLKGKTILLQYDVITPRPYSRLQTVCGSRGYISKYPLPQIQLEGTTPIQGEQLSEFLQNHIHPLEKKYRPDALRLNISNMMNYIMDRRLIDNLITASAPDISVRDAVLWSSIANLSHKSVSLGSKPVAFPEL